MAGRKKRPGAQAWVFVVFLIVVLAAAGTYFTGFDPETLTFASPSPAPAISAVPSATPARLPGGRVFITVLDVGKADSLIITTPNERAMLIDAGEKGAFPVIQEALERMDIEKLDVIVATHPHADHIGGMQQVIEAYDVGAVYAPSVSADTATYENFIKSAAAKNLDIKETKAGAEIAFDPDVTVEVLAPLSYDYDNMNDCSAVLMLTFGQTKFLLAGDAEKNSEDGMLAAYTNGELNADVLKVAHHGSSTSSTNRFLSAVSPSIAAISTAPESGSSTPHKDVIERLTNLGSEILRTDRDGTITLISDGKSVDYQ